MSSLIYIYINLKSNDILYKYIKNILKMEFMESFHFKSEKNIVERMKRKM